MHSIYREMGVYILSPGFYEGSIEEYFEQLDVELDSYFELDSLSRQAFENHFSGLREAIRESKQVKMSEREFTEIKKQKWQS